MNQFGSKIQANKAGLPGRIQVKKRIMESLEAGMRKSKKFGNTEELKAQQK